MVLKNRIHHFHISRNEPQIASQILRNLCFSFFLGITAVPREIENNAYAKFWGANKVVQVAYSRFHRSTRERETTFFTPRPN